MSNDKTKRPTQKTDSSPSPARFAGVVGSAARRSAPEWREVSAPTLILALSCVQAVGGALLFGATSDGGALALTLFLGSERHKFYFKTGEEASDGLQEISRDLGESLPEEILHDLFGG